jgi:hypothetical protein
MHRHWKAQDGLQREMGWGEAEAPAARAKAKEGGGGEGGGERACGDVSAVQCVAWPGRHGLTPMHSSSSWLGGRPELFCPKQMAYACAGRWWVRVSTRQKNSQVKQDEQRRGIQATRSQARRGEMRPRGATRKKVETSELL